MSPKARSRSRFKPYPKYKPSGVEWLGDIPEGWEKMKLNHLSTRIGDGLHGTPKYQDDSEYSFINGNNLNEGSIAVTDSTKRVSYEEFIEHRVNLNDSTLLLSINGTIGNLAFYKNEPVMLGKSAAYINVTPRLNREYLFFYLKSHFMQAHFEFEVTGTTIFNLSLESINNIPIVKPTLPEQRTIAAFLDRETARIDRLVGQKERLIELLQEKRTALISEMVTGKRSLIRDPKDGQLKAVYPKELARYKKRHPEAVIVDATRTKPSGVEWLGDVPEEWTIKRLKYMASIKEGQVDPKLDEYKIMPLIAPNHIESKTGNIIAIETAEDQAAISGKYMFKENDVLYSKIRPALQKACLATQDGLCSADMYPLSAKNGVEPKFLLIMILSDNFTKFAVDQSMRVAMPKINREALERCLLALPSHDDQKAICEYIDWEFNKIDKLTTKIQEAIGKLKEYRTALISAAVTGKIDVRKQ